MKISLLAAPAAALLLTASAATAGSHVGFGGPSSTTSTPQRAVQSSDWSGLYVGGVVNSVSETSLDLDEGSSFDIEGHIATGAFIGYQAQRGQFVFGAEYGFSIGGNVAVTDIADDFSAVYSELKGRLGYATGPVLLYGVIGSSVVVFDDNTFNDFSNAGFGFGAGADYAVRPNFVVGVEYFSRTTTGLVEFDGADTDSEQELSTLGFRAAYKF